MALKTVKKEVPDEIYEHKSENKKMEIYRDQQPIDPRTWDNLTTMVCSHRDYQLGDEEPDMEINGSWESVEENIRKDNDVVAMKKLYLYNHSGITISTSPFNNRWDSSQVGLVYITQEDVEKRGIKEENRTQENYRKWLEGDVKTYDRFLRGDVWKFQLTTNDEGEELIDSCSGFYGHDQEDREHLFENAGENLEEYEKTGGEL